ncbi:MAG: hypothetical protein L0241_18735, partial [Planctomycetia bacterium]|nr:hypothetical protein [Planctomycetia bacterium]
MFDPIVGRWFEEDPKGFAPGDPNLFRYVGNSPTNATDPSGMAYKPIGEIDPKKIEPVLKRVTGTSKDNFEPLQTKVNGYAVYLTYDDQVGKMTANKGVVEVRVYRRLTTGDLFDFTTLTPAKADVDKFPFDKTIT